nr:MAG: terminase large subunit [Caudoviricetes sp.]
MKIDIKANELVSPAYKDLFTSTERYIVYKGSRGSGKSAGIALSIIYKIITEPYVNWLVIRQFQTTHKDSTFANIKWAVHTLGLDQLFKFTVSPLQVTYKPTGQKIYFRGNDDPLKITSIKADVGYLCRVFWEEAYELKSVDDFNTVEESIRGELPKGGYYQTIVAFNPWSEKHWLKSEFFDELTKRSRSIAHTTTYKDNDHLDEGYIAALEEMRVRNPTRARVAVDGEWGVAEGLVFEGLFELEEFDYRKIQGRHVMGLDFGFTHDPTAFVKAIVQDHDIYVYDGFYEQGLLNEPMARMIAQKGGLGSKIYADSASPQIIAELRSRGLSNVMPAGKGKDSFIQRYEFMKSYKYHIHPSVSFLLEEMETKVYAKDKFGKLTNRPADGADHAVQALGYSLEGIVFTNKTGSYMTHRERVEAVKNIGLV